MIRAISFDFHDTLVRCDSWFQHEVYTLASDVLRYLANSSDDSCVRGLLGSRGDSVFPEADALYADIRKEAKASGREVSAQAALVRVLNEQLGADVSATQLGAALAQTQRAYLSDIAPTAGVAGALEQIAALNLPLVVVSNAVYPPFLDWSLEGLGLRRYFGAVITSAGAGYYKTDKRIYQAALAALGNPPAETVVHVGDSLPYDVAGAQAAGMRAIWYNPQRKPSDSQVAQPEAVIGEMSELMQVINGLLED